MYHRPPCDAMRFRVIVSDMPIRILGFILFAVYIGNLTSGCATTREKTLATCAQMDWYEIGRSDGAQGHPLDALANRRKSCGSEFDQNLEAMYVNGRNAGLVEYCDPKNGFEMGRLGVPYSYVCPAIQEPAFLAEYENGKKAHDLETENAKLDQRIADIFQKIPEAESSDEKTELNTELMEARRLRAENEKELSSISK
jgi:hypothetical protein